MDAATSNSTTELSGDATRVDGLSTLPSPSKAGASAKGKLRLITRAQLDQRTVAIKVFDKLALDIKNDLGGSANLSAIELALVDAFCGASIMVDHLNSKLLSGEPVSLGRYSAAVGSMVRLATRLGVKRRAPRNEVPVLGDYLADKQDEAGESEGSP